MKSIKSVRGVMGVAMMALVWGCGGGGSSGSSVDFSALRAQYTAPTGTLSGSDVLQVGAALSRQEQAATAPTPASMQLKPGEIRIQGGSTPMCTGAGSGQVDCTCPGGGSLTESGVSDTGGGLQATIDYDACVVTSGAETESVSGSVSFAEYQSPQTLALYAGTLTVTITPPGTTESVNLNYALVNGVMTFSIALADGNVLVSEKGSWDESTQTGSLTITDKATTWTCTVTSGTGSCTGAGGQTLSF